MPSCANCRPCSLPGPAPAPSAAPTSTLTSEHRPNEVLLVAVLIGHRWSPRLTGRLRPPVLGDLVVGTGEMPLARRPETRPSSRRSDGPAARSGEHVPEA